MLLDEDVELFLMFILKAIQKLEKELRFSFAYRNSAQDLKFKNEKIVYQLEKITL